MKNTEIKKYIVDLFTKKINYQHNDIKKQLWMLINHTIFLYKSKYNKYPLSISDIEKGWIKDEQNILINFINIYQNEINIIILENFVDSLTNHIEEKIENLKKYPQFSELWDDYKNTLEILNINSEWYILLLTEYICSKIENAPKSTKMRQLLKDEYLKNKDLFKTFIYINLDINNTYSDFQEKWNKIKNIINDVEDKLFNTMENWIHANKSVSVKDKFNDFIKSIFPMFNQIGLTTKKLSKEEMQEYIKKMSKK